MCPQIWVEKVDVKILARGRVFAQISAGKMARMLTPSFCTVLRQE